jgi:hypothetical protein
LLNFRHLSSAQSFQVSQFLFSFGLISLLLTIFAIMHTSIQRSKHNVAS